MALRSASAAFTLCPPSRMIVGDVRICSMRPGTLTPCSACPTRSPFNGPLTGMTASAAASAASALCAWCSPNLAIGTCSYTPFGVCSVAIWPPTAGTRSVTSIS